MEANEKIAHIQELVSGRRMFSIWSKNIFLLALKLTCYVSALLAVLAAFCVKSLSLTGLAASSDDPQIIEAVANLPYKWHGYFSTMTTCVALILIAIFVMMLIQGRVINSLNKSNKQLLRISAILKK